MAIDPNRSTFVQQEYRYETVEDLNVKATYASARELIILTNLSEASAASLAAAIYAESSVHAQAYKVTVEGYYSLDDIEGGPLRFLLSMPTYATDGRTFKVTEFEADPIKNRTVFVVRG